MLRRILALLLVHSWLLLAGMDALEDLDFDSHTTRDLGAAAGWPTTSKPAIVVHDIVKRANSNPLYVTKLISPIRLENALDATFSGAYLVFRAMPILRQHPVLLI
jgi:hypothetical protein